MSEKEFETYKYLGLLLGVSFFIFLIKIGASMHGYPYILNVDEPAVVRSSLGLRFDFWINHFDWPHLNYYLNYVFYFVFIKFRGALQQLGARAYLEPYAPIIWNDPFVFYFLSRILNSFMVMISVLPLYLFIIELFEDRANRYTAALFGGLSLLLFNIVLGNSLLALQDPPILLLSTLILYFSIRIFADPNKRSNFIWFGVYVGLATALKYNLGLFGLLIFSSFFSKVEYNPLKIISKIFTAAVFSIIVFLICNISIFKYWDVFWSYEVGKGFLWQITSNVDPLSGISYLLNIFKQTKNLILNNLPVSLFMLAGFIAYCIDCFRDTKYLKIKSFYLAFFILMFLFTSRYGRAGNHYFIPLYPFFALLAGYSTKIFVRERKNILTWVVLCFVLSVIKLVPYFMPDNFTESVKYVQKIKGTENVYTLGDDLDAFNMINNFGFKKAKNDSKIEEQSIIITEVSLDNRPEYVLGKIFDYTQSRGRKVYVYFYRPR